MIHLQIARLIANQLIFLEFSDDDVLHPDTALEVMDQLNADVEAIDKEFLQRIADAFPVIAESYVDETLRQFVRDIPFMLRLEETLLADDPEALARLEARHRAEERQTGRTSNETMD